MGPLAAVPDVHPLATVLREVDAASCPGRCNFHCHTVCSDGSLSPEALADQAVALGLEHLAVTDHHSIAAHGPLQRTLELHGQRGTAVPTLWRGVEISALLEGCLVHLLVLGFSDSHPSLGPYLGGQAAVGPALRAEAVVEAARDADGLVLLAHPARYRLSHRRLIAAAAALGMDGAEAWYDYEQNARWRPTPQLCESIARDLSERGLLQSCGTDTHGLHLHGR